LSAGCLHQRSNSIDDNFWLVELDEVPAITYDKMLAVLQEPSKA
jgi:hypothetical protein